MKNALKRFVNVKMNMKAFSALSVAVFILLMIPIIYIGKYNKPAADDYGYAASTHHAWEATGSVLEALKAVAGRVENSYQTWQGTFSSIFMMALNPAAFDYRLYKLVAGFMVAVLSFSCFLLSKTIFRDVLKKDHSYWISIGAILSILTVEKMHSTPSGIYWYNAAVHYTFMHSMLILLFVVMLKMMVSRKKTAKVVFCIIATFLAVVVGGSNYATGLMGLVLLISLCIGLGIVFKKKVRIGMIPLLTYAVAFYLNISAPGNSVRQGYYQGFSAINSIFSSLKSAFSYSLEWMDIFTFCIALLLIPIFWNALDQCEFTFPLPLAVLGYSFCILATGFTSSYYSMGTEGLSRTHNVIKITYQIFLILNELYIIGWLKNYLTHKKGKELLNLPISVVGLSTLLIIMTGTVFLASNKAGTFATYAAVYFVKTNEAPMFYNEYMARQQVLEGSELEVVLRPYQYRPWILYIDDITEDPNDWRNGMVKEWYGKISVRLSKDGEEVSY